MLLFGTTSKDTCWQLALKAMAPARHIAGGRRNLILVEVKGSFAIDFKHTRISLTMINDLYVYLQGYG